MEICIECQRHIKTSLEACPFCRVPPRVAPFTHIKRTAVVAFTPIFLAACYGGAMGLVEPMPDCNDGSPFHENEWFEDVDGDGYGAGEALVADCNETGFQNESFTQLAGDCDDTNEAVNPSHDEVCGDEIDNNCDEVIDEEDCVEPGEE